MTSLLDKMVQQHLLDPQAAQRVRELNAGGKPLDEALLEAGAVAEEDLLRFLAGEFQVPLVDLESFHPTREFLAQFPARILMKRGLLPLEETNGFVAVATSRLFDTTGIEELRVASGKELRPVLASSAEIDRCIKRFLGVGADTLQSLYPGDEADIEVVGVDGYDENTDLSAAAQEASIIKFVNQVVLEGVELRATDVHFEPYENELRVRYRIDGMLQEASIPPDVRRFQPAIVSRLKILSQLDIAEKRVPQDGRIKFKISGRELDVRVSVIPTLHGEAVVLRLLDTSAPLLGLERLGMAEGDIPAFSRILALPHGIVLVTGPTGSGKTTTLYAALSRINSVTRKIVTIEDPIEYHLRGVNQIQVSTKAGLTFARGLRSILRHDPNIILVGEIRDFETAEIAVQASLTGHLVFSTLHTNDAPSALTRLVDMGVEPYLVGSSLEAVLAQRLIRLICPACREAVPLPGDGMLPRELVGRLSGALYVGRGCRECHDTGYRGRRGIFELMFITDEIRARIVDKSSATEIRRLAIQQGMRTLQEDGWRHVIHGDTTIEEVLRVTKDERMNGRSAAPAANSPPRGDAPRSSP